MAQRTKIAALDTIRDIQITRTEHRSELIEAWRRSVENASELVTLSPLRSDGGAPLRLAIMASLQTATAVMHAVEAQCTLAAPPADLEMQPGPTGDLILTCLHTPPHRWDLKGTRLP